MIKTPLLLIESSGPICSVALSDGLTYINSKATELPKQHIGQLAVLVRETLDAYNLKVSDLKLIALSAGPGSYTGLRVAYALVKGMVFNSEVAVASIPTHEIILRHIYSKGGILKQPSKVIMHARKDEYITYDYDKTLNLLGQTEVKYSQLLNISAEYEGNLVSDHTIDGISQLIKVQLEAKTMIEASIFRYNNQQTEAPELIAPIYYKPPYITTRKKKLI